MVAKDFKLFDDMDEWKEKVKFPPLDFMPIEQIFQAMCGGMHVNPETDVVSCLILSGQFERMNQLIGMENALCAFYEYPDEVHEFFDAMCEYKLKCIDLAYKYLKPDVIHMHDDWGTNKNLFFSPEIWREFIKPNEEKYVKRIHDHSACSTSITPVVMSTRSFRNWLKSVSMPWSRLCFVMISKLQSERHAGDKITLMGGIDNQMIDQKGTDEDVIRAEVRRAMDTYVGKGRYIPYYIPTNKETFGIYIDEVTKYGKDIFHK